MTSQAKTVTLDVPAPGPDSKSDTPVGAIAGGTVGGVAALVVVAVAAWFYRRRRRRQREQANPAELPEDQGSQLPRKPEDIHSTPISEADSRNPDFGAKRLSTSPGLLSPTVNVPELPTDTSRHELPDNTRSELEG